MTTLKQIDARIQKFGASITSQKVDAHAIVMMITRHAAPQSFPNCDGTGNCDRILRLAMIMPTSWQVQLLHWCEAFTPIRFNVKSSKGGFSSKYKELAQDDPARLEWWKIAEGEENPFYEYSKEPSAAQLMYLPDLVDYLPAAIKRLEKTVDGEGKRKVAGDALGYAIYLVETLKAAQATVKTPEQYKVYRIDLARKAREEKAKAKAIKPKSTRKAKAPDAATLAAMEAQAA